MKYFLTGATGFIGKELAKKLLDRGDTIHALVRSPEKGKEIEHKNLHLFPGDVTNPESIEIAIQGCDFVFHLAGYAKPWSKDKSLPEKINIDGTRNVLEAAMRYKIKRVVFTSTAGVLKPSEKNEIVDENSPNPDSYLTDYERTKREAELLCGQYVNKGLDIVLVNPSRVYGPGELSKSNSVTTIIKKYSEGKWRVIPGSGAEIGNYVFISDIVNGHLIAMEKGQPGERYILGGTNASFLHFFEILSQQTGRKLRLFHLPLWVMTAASKTMLFIAENMGGEPLITPQWVKRYNQDRILSSEKAVNQLGYSITPLEKGIGKTLDWLQKGKA